MNAFIFVAVICIGQQCDFMVSQDSLPATKCEALKEDFLVLPFKPEVTLAATQCIKIEPRIKI